MAILEEGNKQVKRREKSHKRINVISTIACDAYLSVDVLDPGQKFNCVVFAEFLRNKVVPFLNPYNCRNARSVFVLGN